MKNDEPNTSPSPAAPGRAPKLPCLAWLIRREPTNYVSFSIVRVLVTSVQADGTARCQIEFPPEVVLRGDGRYATANKIPPVKLTCKVCELASTRARALLKLEELLTALESRPATPHVAQGQPPEGKTDSGAA